MAVIDAFHRAFPPGYFLSEWVGLVIKTLKPAWPHEAWD